MAKPSKSFQSYAGPSGNGTSALEWGRKSLYWWLPFLYLLIADSFYLRTYDSAQVKITLVQMGGVCLIAMWLCVMALEGWKAFHKEDLVCLSPFLAYLALNIVSFLQAPYRGPSVDDFFRYIFYMSVALIVIREFDVSAVERFTKFLKWAAAIAAVYGLVQWLDTRFFPRGVGMGIDPFVWRGAFGKRIFSTFGNPNFFANFLVLMFPILLSQYFKTRSLGLIPLLFLIMFNIFMTRTRGSWVGFAVCMSLYTFAYVYFFIQGDKKATLLKKVLPLVLVFLMGFSGLLYYSLTRAQKSVNFRVFTWLSTWEMIESQPWTGTGTGSFKVIYPAYRRPGIFHIEGKHNTETDHAENEWLEQWFDHGIWGFGIFLWLIAATCWTGLSALKQLTSNLAQRGGRPPPRAYDLFGYLMAFVGMLAHNSFDVSMRFVSSGVFFGLLPGLILNLSRGCPLWQIHWKRQHIAEIEERSALLKVAAAQGPGTEDSRRGSWEWPPYVLWPLRIASWAGLGYVSYKVLTEFSVLQGPLARVVHGGEVLQWWISWTILITLVAGAAVILFRVALLGKTPVVPIIVLSMLWPLYFFWGFFKADVHHNIAIFFSKQRKWDHALENYAHVNRLNPYFIMPYYFRGNVFNDRFDMKEKYNPKWGDKEGAPRNDFDRAMEAYGQVRRIAPNYVQMHHQIGVLYLKRGQHALKQGKKAEGQKYFDRAIARFNMYHDLDPVFKLNYFRQAQIHLSRRHHDKAISQYKEYVEAPLCYGHRGLEFPKTKGHDDAEAHFNLGNAYFMKGSLVPAGKAYQRALEINPNHRNSRKNLALLKKQMGRISASRLGVSTSAPPRPAKPGVSYDLIPSRR